ncbi:MAG: hypothetical protein EOS77_31670 [Mesorhizobium sp.]|nr:MAG: hypothetical protein EOS77_31670 [Mesorhizobium sp.]
MANKASANSVLGRYDPPRNNSPVPILDKSLEGPIAELLTAIFPVPPMAGGRMLGNIKYQ